jgi:hypothetical protein
MYALVAMGHGYLIENARIVGAGRAAGLLGGAR